MDYLKDLNQVKMPSNFQAIDPQTKIKEVNSWWEIIKFSILAFIIIVPIRLFIVQPFIVSGESMIPTFHDGDYLIIDEISYRLHGPRRGDVIVFHPPKQKKDIYYIKRIIGLPGETITVKNGKVSITDNNTKTTVELNEPYLQNFSSENATYLVGTREIFVMGDNRPRSSDSRAWGMLPIENVTGRALVRLFPFRTIQYLPGAQQAYTSINEAVASLQ